MTASIRLRRYFQVNLGKSGAGVLTTMAKDFDSGVELLRTTTARYVANVWPLDEVRRVANGGEVSLSDRSRTAELGWFSPFAAEEFGGGSASGSSIHDVFTVAVERGKALVPGAFVSNNVAVFSLSEVATGEQRTAFLGELIAGEKGATWALAIDRGSASVDVGVATASRRNDDFEISGEFNLVQDTETVDWILVDGEIEGEKWTWIVSADAPGVEREICETLDLTAQLGRVSLDRVRVGADECLGGGPISSAHLEDRLNLANALIVGDMLGVMERLLAQSVAYAKDRFAFGRPIGSFQAIKHLIADMSMRFQASLSTGTAMVEALQSRDDHASEIVSIAKSFVAENGHFIGQGALQIHGGIGYTWESDLHLSLRRLASDAVLYGDATFHRERILQLHGL
jgi:alkylation response protein AidB-like acyl-CoA dehydrogenase